MIGMLLGEMEVKEIQYLLKREMDEIIFDLEDRHIDRIVKNAMEERYKVLYSLFKRISTHKECLRYMRPRQKERKNNYKKC
jgi:6-phosphogluconate dehydrogenase (decarboxylating)